MSENINSVDDLKKRLAPLDKLIQYKTEFKRTFGNSGSGVVAAYQVMKRHLLALAPEGAKPVKAGPKEKECVMGATRMMVSVVTSGSISKYFRDFAAGYLPLLNTWNIQIGKDRTIGAMIAATQRILDDMMTMKDATDVTRGATRRLRQLLRYKPAGFDLSRHYLQSLQEDIEKKEAGE